MGALRKITIQIDSSTLEKAQESSQAGITETIRQGLKLLASKKAYQNATKLRGKFKKIKIDVDALRDDK